MGEDDWADEVADEVADADPLGAAVPEPDVVAVAVADAEGVADVEAITWGSAALRGDGSEPPNIALTPHMTSTRATSAAPNASARRRQYSEGGCGPDGSITIRM